MLEPSRSNDHSKVRRACKNKAEHEVGRIVLGDRIFKIVSISDPSSSRYAAKALSRFEIAGASLVVLETTIEDRRNANEAAREIAGRLTGRELEIAVLVAQGHATKNIAYRLQISEWTVATYLRRIFAKLDVDSRAAMVYRCASLIDASLAAALKRHGSALSARQ